MEKQPEFRTVTVLREKEIKFEDLKEGDLFFLYPASNGDCVDSGELCIAQSDAKPETPIGYNSGIAAQPLKKVGMQIHNTTCSIERRLLDARNEDSNKIYKEVNVKLSDDSIKCIKKFIEETIKTSKDWKYPIFTEEEPKPKETKGK